MYTKSLLFLPLFFCLALRGQPPCDAINSAIFIENQDGAVAAPPGDPALDLDLTLVRGDEIILPITGQVVATDPTTVNSYGATGSPEVCQQFTRDAYAVQTIRFSPSNTGMTEFTVFDQNGAPAPPYSVSIHEDPFEINQGCDSWIGASLFNRVQYRPRVDVPLQIGETYFIFIQQRPDRNYPINYRISTSENTLYTGEPFATNYDYTYIATEDDGDGNMDNDAVVANSATADFTTLPEGNYRVHGVNYDEDIDPGSWIGQSLSAIRQDPQGGAACLQTSSNQIPVVVGDDVGEPAPVEWLSFTVDPTEGGAALTWKVASETDNAYFRVERSPNGRQWEDIAEVMGNGTTQTAATFDFVDEDPLPGASFYRLMQVDFDGTENPSVVVAYENAPAPTVLQLFPNPVNDRLNVSVTQGRAPQGRPRIFDLYGRELPERNVQTVGNQLQIPTVDLPRGAYLLRWGGQTLRFVKGR